MSSRRMSPGRHDLLGGGQRETAREHGQAAEDRPLVLGEQVMAPVEGRAQGLVAERRRAGPADQDREHVVQPLRQLAGGQDPHPRGGQLDRERQAVDAAAHLQDRGGVVVREPERRQHQLRPLLEEPDRVVRGQRGRGRCRPVLGQRERRDRPAPLPVHAEHLAAGGEDGQGRAGAEQPLGEVGRGGRQVLAVVQDEQQRCVAHMLGDCLRGVPPRAVGHAEAGGHRLADDGRIIDRGQLNPARAGREGRPGRAGRGQGQPGLPGPARARQREQPAARQAVQHILELTLPADQRNEPGREPPGIQRAATCPAPPLGQRQHPPSLECPVAHRAERPGPGPGPPPLSTNPGQTPHPGQPALPDLN